MSRSERLRQREQATALRDHGFTWVDIATRLRRQWSELNPRSSLRIAHGWTQREAADAWNRLWPDQPKTDRDIGIWELRRPGLQTLSKLARVYECAVSDLLDDVGNFRHLDPVADRAGADGLVAFGELGDVPTRWDEGAAEQVAELLTMAEDTTQPVDHHVSRIIYQWLIVPPPQTVQLDAGRRVGVSLVDQVHQRVAQLCRLDDFIGGRDSLHLVERELALTSELVRKGSYEDQVGRRLLSEVGRLSWLAGWVSADAGHDALAVARYGAGVRACHIAGDQAGAANLVSTLGYQLTNSGQLRRGVEAARTAMAGLDRVDSPAVRALIGGRTAWAYASIGDADLTYATLDQVDVDVDRLGSVEDPEWAYWLDRTEAEVMRARCMILLGRPDLAVRVLGRVLESYDPHRGRELALYTSWLAQAQADVGELDEAASRATRAVELAGGAASARADERVRSLRVMLAPHAASPAVRDFLDVCAGL